MDYHHTPVLSQEIADILLSKKVKVIVDATLGGGGHADKLKMQNAKLKIIGIDQDEVAIEAAKQRLGGYNNITYVHDNFKNLKNIVKEKVGGILFDLGVSSYQIDAAERGFSFQKDGPLDMRMDQAQKLTAEKIINEYSQKDLEAIFKEYGEERFFKKVAAAVVSKRKLAPIKTTRQLNNVIENSIPTWRKRESSSRIFQALRIAVNSELNNLFSVLQDALDLLSRGGRIAVISYHSLEDRIVKRAFKKGREDGILKILTEKPLRPALSEISSNPRAKSAKLRAAEKT